MSRHRHTNRLQVLSSEFIDYTGALCQPGDGEYLLSEPGDASKSFLARADPTGIQGTFGAGILRQAWNFR